MGNIKKVGEEYYIEFYARGLLYQQKAGSNHSQAEALLADIEAKISMGELSTISHDVDLDVFFHSFCDYAITQHSIKTFRRFQSVVDNFNHFLCENGMSEGIKLSQVTPSVLEKYRIYILRERPKYLNLALILLKEVFDYGIKHSYINDNPVLHIKFDTAQKHRAVYLLPENEMQVILTDLMPQMQFISGNLNNVVEIKLLLQKFSLLYKISFHRLRHIIAINLLKKGVGLAKLYKYLGLDDIAKVLCYIEFLPKLV